MIHLIWSLFEKTGDVETYLLLKQLENDEHTKDQSEITLEN